MVKQAAIKINDNEILTLPRPARHADIIESFKIKPYNTRLVEGFLDENDKFLTRTEALAEARRSKQTLINYWDDLERTTELYSENLW